MKLKKKEKQINKLRTQYSCLLGKKNKITECKKRKDS